MLRRTKIVSTLGPASESPEVLEKLILAGVDVVRLNFSHGTPDEHKARARLIREIAARQGLALAGRVDREAALGAQPYGHRAQLGVYLRMLDVPVPAMYGPTADTL